MRDALRFRGPGGWLCKRASPRHRPANNLNISVILMFSSSLLVPLVTLVTYAAVFSAIPAVSAAPSLTVKTSAPDVDIDGLNSLKVITTVANTGEETLKLLNDPHGVLSPFPGDAFTITDPSGSRLAFSGAPVSHVPDYR